MFHLDKPNHTQAFEADSLRELSDTVSEYYAEQGEGICEIEAVYFENDNGARSTLSVQGLALFVAECETENEQANALYDEADQGRRESISDYYASVI